MNLNRGEVTAESSRVCQVCQHKTWEGSLGSRYCQQMEKMLSTSQCPWGLKLQLTPGWVNWKTTKSATLRKKCVHCAKPLTAKRSEDRKLLLQQQQLVTWQLLIQYDLCVYIQHFFIWYMNNWWVHRHHIIPCYSQSYIYLCYFWSFSNTW